MTPHDQMILGFNQMRAGFAGKHSIMASWLEIADMQHGGKSPHVIEGALGFLLISIIALENAQPLPELKDPRMQQIFENGHEARLAACLHALRTGNSKELHCLVTALAELLQPTIKHISYTGVLKTEAQSRN